MGNKTKISITRALAKVKLIEVKLGKTFSGFDVEVGKKLKYSTQFTKEEFIKEVKGEKDSFDALFNNRLQIKSAIAKANISTKVELLGNTYSIIELIDLKGSANYKINLLENLIKQYNRCDSEVKSIEEKIEEEVSKQVGIAQGNKSQISKDIVSSLTSTYTELWQGSIVGLDIVKITKEKDELVELLSEIDMCLSEINSKTEIEVEL